MHKYKFKYLHKLLASFSVTVAVTIIMFILYVKQDQNTISIINGLFAHRVDTLEVSDHRSRAFKIRIAEIEMTKFTDVWPAYDAADKIQDQITHFEEHIESCIVNKSVKADLVAQFKKSWMFYRNSVEKTIMLVRKNKLSEAKTNLSYFSQPRFDVLIDQLNQITVIQQEKAKKLFLRNEVQLKSARFVFLVISMASIGLTIILAIFLACSLSRKILRLRNSTLELALGKLVQQPLPVTGSDEIDDLAQAFNSMQFMLHSTLLEIKKTTCLIDQEAKNVVAASNEQSKISTRQATALAQTSLTVNQIALNSEKASEQASSVISTSERSETVTKEGLDNIQQAMEGMRILAEQVGEISEAIDIQIEHSLRIADIMHAVKDFAENTNLLSLNASLEAAQAGERARGFTVVAGEMRKLAEQTKRAVNDVRSILGEIEVSIRQSVQVTNEGRECAHSAMTLAKSGGSSIARLAAVIRETCDAARSIAGNTQQQTISISELVLAIADLSDTNTGLLEGTKRIERVASNLNAVSERLSDITNKYQL